MNLIKSSYDPNEVTILLKDVTGLVTPLGTEEREKLNQNGTHYSEMLPVEYEPTEDYMKIYREELKNNANKVAKTVVELGDKLFFMKGTKLVLISLARAGTPIGILLKRYLKMRYNSDIPHYSISIIRGKGIDVNALDYIVEHEKSKISGFQFVDGWIGKGAIQKELNDSITKYLWDMTMKGFGYIDMDSHLAVLSDPALVVPEMYCGTREDFIIPSSCLNATVSGLFSRTFRRQDIIGEKDFDGAISYSNLKEKDESNNFLDTVTIEIKKFVDKKLEEIEDGEFKGIDEVKKIAQEFDISDINKIKPGVGETTRVLLRRVPYLILVSEKWQTSKDLEGIVQLCTEKNIPIKPYPLKRYKAVGIIKDVSDL